MKTIAALVDRLASIPGVRPGDPATDEQIRRYEAAVGLTLPAEVRELYRTCNGMELPPRFMRLMSLSEAESLTEAINSGDLGWGIHPLTENNDSNHVCLFTRAPLIGYVAHIFHDDEPRLLFRTLGEFLAAVTDELPNPAFDFRGMRSAFDAPARTEADRRIATALLARAGGTGPPPGGERPSFVFALKLLGDEDVPDIVRLLDHADFQIGGAARDRLAELTSPAATEAFSAYQTEFGRFAERVRTELAAAGVDSTIHRPYGRPAIRVGVGHTWLNLDAFFPWRNQPQGYEKIVRRVRELIVLGYRSG